MSYYDQQAKAEQLEAMRERVKKEIDAMAQCSACVDTAVAKAKASLEVLRTTLAKVRAPAFSW